MDIRNARSKFGEALQQAVIGEHSALLNPSTLPRNDPATNANQGLGPTRVGRRARLLAAKALERPGVIRLYERRIDLASFLHDESPSLYELVRVWLTDVGQITQNASSFLDENSASLANICDPLFACVKSFTPRKFDKPKPLPASASAAERPQQETTEDVKVPVDSTEKEADAAQRDDTSAAQSEQSELKAVEGESAMLDILVNHIAHWRNIRARHKRGYEEFVESNYENFRAIDECVTRRRMSLGNNQ